MKLVYIPPGEFAMGSGEPAVQPPTDSDNPAPEGLLHQRDDLPKHRVRITKGFYIGAYHVTVAQFRRFVDRTRYKTEVDRGVPHDAHGPGGGATYPELMPHDRSGAYTWRSPPFRQGEDHPVVEVSWEDAVAFCRWLSREERKSYRLPREAEWEYVCRAGTKTRYCNGNDPEKLPEVANVADATLRETLRERFSRLLPGPFGAGGSLPQKTIRAKDGYVYTSPVGVFKPNAWGVYDMHGNVEQWCADGYDETYYTVSPHDDPTGPAKPPYDFRVLRGGSWLSPAAEAFSFARDRRIQWVATDFIGFRVVLDTHSTTGAGNDNDAEGPKDVLLDDLNTKDSDICSLVPQNTVSFRADGLRIGRLAVEHLGRCRRLEQIILGSTEVSDNDLAVLSRLPHLTVLDLSNTPITNAGLKFLSGCRTLKELDVCGTHITERGVAEFRARRPELNVSWSAVPSEAVRQAVVELWRMEILVTHGPLSLDTPEKKVCRVIFGVDWDGDVTKAHGLLKVAIAREQDVYLDVRSLKRPGLEFLRDLRQVQRLYVRTPGLVDKDLSVLRTLGCLKSLGLMDPRFSDEAQCFVAEASLDPKSPGFTVQALHYVAEVSSLEGVSLDGFNDAAIDPLAKLPRLTTLRLSGPTFTKNALEHCAKLPHLKALSVGSCGRISNAARERFFATHSQITPTF